MAEYASSPNAFYRYNFPVVISLMIICMLVIFGLVGLVLYQVLHRPLPYFVAVAPNGKKMPLASYDEPNFLPNTVLTWASKAAVAAYTFNFVNYDKQMQLVRPFFTTDGWQNYQSSLQGLINTIVTNKLMVNSVVSGPPIIANQGNEGDGYQWRIQMPFLVTYQSAETKTQKNFMVQMTVRKVQTQVDPSGIGIDQFAMS